MGGDYSRFTHKPAKRYAGVLMQQGRVQLDADWNEQWEIAARRWQHQAADTMGPSAVPAATTPDGFLISGAALNIHPGRIYVEGLLAEILGNENYSYANQPYYPDPSSIVSMTGSAGIVYLDVWQREVTHIQDPALLEKALGGVDTTTRIHTVWQVKVHDMGSATVDCETDLAALFPPSGGRLSSQANAPATSSDPCALSPTGGYRGMENRLYRVEVHQGGSVGSALFKWSRDNAALTVAVEEITASGGVSVLKVGTVGRDQVVCFKVDDWVEITDEHRELMDEGGDMARVAFVNEAERLITLDRAVPTAGHRAFNAADEARRTRLQRWDQQLSIDGDGLVTTTGTWFELEHGVEVNFSQAAGLPFKRGDYWLFHARSIDGSVDALVAAPPRGIHHHYTPLATLSGVGTATPVVVDDCRDLWPPSFGVGCCTVYVSPGEDIQAAIDSLPDEGGCVCLKTGFHDITAPIWISRSNVVMRGETPDTWVRSTGIMNLLLVGDAGGGWINDVTIERVRFDMPDFPAADSAIPAMAYIQRGERIRVRDCSFRMSFGQPIPVIGIWLQRGYDIVIEGNRLHRHYQGVYASDVEQLKVCDNAMKALTYEATDELEIPIGMWGVHIENEPDSPCVVQGNSIKDYWIGIRLNDGANGSKLIENDITRPLLLVEGDIVGGTFWSYAIEADAADCTVQGNNIGLEAPFYGGIRVTAHHAVIDGNRIMSPIEAEFEQLPVGIFIDGSGHRAADHCMIRNNVLEGYQNAILLAEAQGAQVTSNHIDGWQQRGQAIMVSNGVRTCIDDNRIQQAGLGIGLKGGNYNSVERNRIIDGSNAIIVQEESTTEVSHNTIDYQQNVGVGGLNLLGRISITHNRITNCGHSGLPAGIGILLSYGDVAVESCEIMDTGLARTGDQATSMAAIGLSAWSRSCRVSNNRVAYTAPGRLNTNLNHRALLLVGPLSFHVEEITLATGSALVSDNVFHGPGRQHLVEFVQVPISDFMDLRFEKVTFSNNYCEHVFSQTDQQDAATVLLWGSQFIVMGNHVKAHQNMHSIDLNNRSRVTLMGNITTGNYIRVGTVVPVPITNFNVIL